MALETMTRELVEWLAGKLFDDRWGEILGNGGGCMIDCGTFGNTDASIDCGGF